jgi:hypothetical protein
MSAAIAGDAMTAVTAAAASVWMSFKALSFVLNEHQSPDRSPKRFAFVDRCSFDAPTADFLSF